MTEDASGVLVSASDDTDLTRAEEIGLWSAAIVESLDDAIIAKTFDGVICAWNPAAERMFGYTQHEAIGRPIAMIVPLDLQKEEDDILRRLGAGERIDHYETVRATKGGESIDISLTISPLRDSAGRIIGCSEIARAITRAQQRGVARRRSERRLTREVAGAKTLQSISTRLISESTPESLYDQIVGAAVELMVSDAACLQMLTADNTTLRLLAWTNFHPDCVPFWERVAAGAGSSCSKALSDNQRVVVADIEACEFMAGTQEQAEYRRAGVRGVQSTPLRSRTGRLLGMLSTHWRTPHSATEDDFRFFDVLARQAADLIERTLAEEALRDSEERFRLIANSAPVMIWMSGADHEITYLNQTWLDYAGQPSDDAAVETLRATVLHPDEAEQCREVYENAFERREPFQLEHRLRRHDGEYRWVVTAGEYQICRGWVVCRLHRHEPRHHRAEACRSGSRQSKVNRRTRGGKGPNRPRASRRHQPTGRGAGCASRDPATESSGFSDRCRAADRGNLPPDRRSGIRYSGAVARPAFPEARTHRAESGGGGFLQRVLESA